MVKARGKRCSVKNCCNYDVNWLLSFFRFPDPINDTLFRKWKSVCSEYINKKDHLAIQNNCRICSIHFESDQIRTTKSGKSMLQAGAVPTLNLFQELFTDKNIVIGKNVEIEEHYMVIRFHNTIYFYLCFKSRGSPQFFIFLRNTLIVK